MNGSENSYASALFFTLITLGALLKIDDVTSYAIGAGAAILAAVSLRHALNKSAQATEENHQRMEVQFQQLRTKIIEASSASTTAMNSLNVVTKLLQDNLKTIREQSTSLDSLINLVKGFDEINLTLASLEKNFTALNVELEKNFSALNAELEKNFSALNAGLEENFSALNAGLEKNSSTLNAELEENFSAINIGLEKISTAIQSQEKFSDSEGLKKLIAVEEMNKANLQSVLKILNFVLQIMKTPAYSKSLDKINSTIEKLAAQKNPTYTEELAEINSAIKELIAQAENNSTYPEGLDALKISADDANKNLSELVRINGALSRSFTTTLDDLRLDMVKLAARLEEINTLINKNIRVK